MRLVGAVAVILRRLRAERGVALLLFVLVAVTSFVGRRQPAAVRPGRRRRPALRGGSRDVRPAEPPVHDVDRIRPTRPTPFANVVARGEAAPGVGCPRRSGRLVASRTTSSTATRFRLADPPNYTTYITLRQQDGLESASSYVAGRPARRAGAGRSGRPAAVRGRDLERDRRDVQIEPRRLLPADVDPGDPMLRNVFPRPTTAVVFDVVGLFTGQRAARAVLVRRDHARQAAIGGTDENPIAFATGLFAPEAYAGRARRSTCRAATAGSFRRADRLDAGQLGRALPRTCAGSSRASGPPGPARTAAPVPHRPARPPRAIRRPARRGRGGLSVAAIGPLAVAAGALGLVGRHRPGGAAAHGPRARSRRIGRPTARRPALGGAARHRSGRARRPAARAAAVLVPARGRCRRSGRSSWRWARPVLLGASWPVARRAARAGARRRAGPGGSSPRRLVVEATIVGLAVAAAWLLRERGVGGGTAGGPRGPDPFLAAAPVLIGVAVGLVAMRLYPMPIRALGWLTAAGATSSRSLACESSAGTRAPRTCPCSS